LSDKVVADKVTLYRAEQGLNTGGMTRDVSRVNAVSLALLCTNISRSLSVRSTLFASCATKVYK
jgi:hypothetical protein